MRRKDGLFSSCPPMVKEVTLKNRNTMRQFQYIWRHLFWGALMTVNYKTLLFCNVLDWSYFPSLALLIGLVVASSIIGILLTWKNRRNYVSLTVSLAIGFGAYFIIAYWEVAPFFTRLLLTFQLIGVLGYLAVAIVSYGDAVRSKKAANILPQYVGHNARNCRNLIGTVFAVVLLCLMGLRILQVPIFKTKASLEANIPYGSAYEDAMDSNIEVICLLREDAWANLSVEERVNVLQVVADIEALHLGIPRVPVSADIVVDAGTLGYFRPSEKRITLSKDYLANCLGHSALDSILHEMYHAYQHEVVEVYESLDEDAKKLALFNNAAQYSYEFANYSDGSTDFHAYYSQACELHANQFAEDWSFTYYYKSYEYLFPEGEDHLVTEGTIYD